MKPQNIGFIAQVVEHCTGIAEVMGLNLVEALVFSGFVFPIASIGKLTAMIILHLNYFIYTSHYTNVPDILAEVPVDCLVVK